MKQLNKESRATRLLAAIIFGTESKMNVLSKISSFSDQIHQKASYKALILGQKLQSQVLNIERHQSLKCIQL